MKEEVDKNRKEIEEAINCVSEIRDCVIGINTDNDIYSIEKEEARILIERLENSERKEFIRQSLQSKNREKDVEKLLNHLNSFKNRRRKVLLKRVSILVAASAASLIIFFVALFYNNENKSLSQVAKTADELKPTLKNESGELISLDKITATVETESYAIKKHDKTKLEYVAKDSSKEEILHLSIPAGFNYTVLLSDGTEVTLNGGSELKYPTKFDTNVRQVEFTGEAYFKVAKAEQPFVVNSKGMYIKVYGTEFNVNTQQKNRFETVLVDGSVGVGVIGEKDTKIKPNQMYEYDFSTKTEVVYNVETDNYISWRNNFFCYQSRQLEAVIADISAWYGVEFISKKDISDLPMTFNIERSTNIDELLLFIESLTDLRFVKEKKGGYVIE